MTIAELTDEELKRMAYELYDLIYVADCFGVPDMYNYSVVLAELNRRGYTFNEESRLKIVKPMKRVHPYGC